MYPSILREGFTGPKPSETGWSRWFGPPWWTWNHWDGAQPDRIIWILIHEHLQAPFAYDMNFNKLYTILFGFMLTKRFECIYPPGHGPQPPDTICLEEPGLVDKDQDRVESLGMLTISWVTSDKQVFLLRTSAVRHPEYNKNLRYAK